MADYKSRQATLRSLSGFPKAARRSAPAFRTSRPQAAVRDLRQPANTGLSEWHSVSDIRPARERANSGGTRSPFSRNRATDAEAACTQ